MKMKSTKDSPRVAHNIDITEVDHEYFVCIDGLPLNEAPLIQARFQSSQEAFDAANAAIIAAGE
jgi:hypothetical protein